MLGSCSATSTGSVSQHVWPPQRSYSSGISLQSPSAVPGGSCGSRWGLESPEISCPSMAAHGMGLTFSTGCTQGFGLALLEAEDFQKAFIWAPGLPSHI